MALPGIPGTSGPVGFEPGMFKHDKDEIGAPKVNITKKKIFGRVKPVFYSLL